MENAVGEQEVFMFSGLDREQAASCRQQAVAWVWIKARGIVNSRTAPARAKLTSSVLLSSECSSYDESANWRDSLAALTNRNLARQLCEQFYDLYVLHASHTRPPEAVTVSRMLRPALPAYCRDMGAESAASAVVRRNNKARILDSVLPHRTERRGAVLIALRSKAA
jgi:hypothetical protein